MRAHQRRRGRDATAQVAAVAVEQVHRQRRAHAADQRGTFAARVRAQQREVLHARAPQLPELGGAYVDFADDTEDALASGCDGAAIALIERSLDAAEQRLGRRPRLILHGGGSEALSAQLRSATQVATLVLEGLALWAGVERSA